MITSFINEMAY